jgi:hypothetical protein
VLCIFKLMLTFHVDPAVSYREEADRECIAEGTWGKE